MSSLEEACRWSIAEAYLAWRIRQRPWPTALNWLAYCRALGLEPTDPPRAEEGPEG